MKVTLSNQSPHELKLWWLDGQRGVDKGTIQPGDEYRLQTYISHTFFARPSFVEGNTLTNESGLLWYTAKVVDDGATIAIHDRCFDRSGECVRWRSEGFCDANNVRFSPYVQQNPGHVHFCLHNCPVSCKTGCGSPVDAQQQQQRRRSPFHDPSQPGSGEL